MSDTTPPAVPGVPAEADKLFREILDQPLETRDALRAEVRVYLANVRDAAVENEQIELGLAEALAKRSDALLDRVGPGAPQASRRLVQAAVRYFILDEDAEGDLDSVAGFDDDVGVMNAVVRYLGHADLVIDVD